VTRAIKTELLLAENIRTLLARRGADASSLAAWCGHKPPWISKILRGGRGVQLKDLGRIADFFGLTVAELFHFGIGTLAERRKYQRRSGTERRKRGDRRVPPELRRSQIHPDVQPRFPTRTDDRTKVR
jgi:hypothetical protein